MQGPLNRRMWREGWCESKEMHLESDSIHLQVNRLGWNGEGRVRRSLERPMPGYLTATGLPLQTGIH